MPDIAIVDKKDKIIGFIDKEEVHKQNILHRAFSIFIFDKRMNLLIQKRSKQKYHSAGLWSNSCCSHQEKGEELEQAINRCMENELGVVINKRISVGKFHYNVKLENGMNENELDTIYIAFYNGEKININRDEIEKIEWININKLTKDIEVSPEKYTYWFKYILKEVMFWGEK